MSYSMLTHLECSDTGEAYDADTVQQLSRSGAPLLARYDLDAVRSAISPGAIAARPPDLWRYHELLPVRDPGNVTTLGEGMTPLLPLPRYGTSIDLPRLLMKDESLVPTGTFKARGAAVGGVPGPRTGGCGRWPCPPTATPGPPGRPTPPAPGCEAWS